MSTAMLSAAQRVLAVVSPLARLTLLAIADGYAQDDGSAVVRDLSALSAWTQQPAGAVQKALRELEDAHLLYRDEQFTNATAHSLAPSLTPNAWLTFVPGWERSWENLVWRTFRVRRQAIPPGLRAEVMDRDARTCQRCGSTNDPTIDHRHPVTRGGLTILANLQVLCGPCNNAKGARL